MSQLTTLHTEFDVSFIVFLLIVRIYAEKSRLTN